MTSTSASMIEESAEPPMSKKPTRVAQLSAKIKSVASVSDKSKSVSKQKRPAPALPAEAKRVGERLQELNGYVASKARGEPVNYLDLVRSLGELRSVGEKGHRQLVGSVLPRLAQHEVLPASLVPQLVQLAAASDDRRLVRMVYYLLQLVLGQGSAGTPSPAAGEATPAVVSLPADISGRAWAGAALPETPSALADLQLRTLAAASRAVDVGKPAESLGAAVRAVLARAEAGVSLGQGKASKAQRKEQAGAWELHWSALVAARAALTGRALSKLAVNSSVGIVSPEAGGARHALALLTLAMRENAAAVFKEDKDLAGLMAVTASVYEESGPVVGGAKRATAVKRRTINFADKWGRLELARLCSAAVYADWTSTQDFVDRVGAPFWKMLCLLATRDREGMVALEAVRCLFGSMPASRRTQGAAGEEARNVKLCVRAWILVSATAGVPAGDGEEDSLAAVIERRLAECMGADSPIPLRCTACRAAGSVLEAAARSSIRSSKAKQSSALQTMVQGVTDAVRAAAQGDPVPAVRCAALEALLWTQALFGRIYQVLRAIPAAAPQLLQLAGGVASSAAAALEADQLLELWSAAMKLPDGKTAAMSAALSLLSSPTPGAPSSAAGVPASARLRAAADEAGWLELLRNTAWWLGENANLACNEFAGSPPPPDERNQNEAPQAATTPLETAALQAFRNPRMAAVISHLQHAALTRPPGPRTAAVQALAKVAVRSEEPYRLQCYSILASLDTSRASSAPDTHGVASAVQPVLPILDMLYSSRLVLEELAEGYGRMPHKWPPAMVAQLRQRNSLLEQRIQRIVCSLSGASYFVLGPLSRDLLTSGIDSLAPQASLPRQDLAELRTAVSASSQDTLQSPLAGTARHSRHNSMMSEAAGNALFSGPDPLAALTENLNQHITAQVFKPRAPAPWELQPLQPPPSIPEEGPSGGGHQPDTPVSLRASQDSRAAPAEGLQHRRERGVAVHAFEAEMSDELSVHTGEEVEVEADVDGWLHCVNRYGIKGLVPAAYVRILGPEEGPGGIAAQLFGGFAQRQHRRERSVDLLNQPDMLAALLGSPAAGEDEWGGGGSLYRTHTRDVSFHEEEYSLVPVASENVDGDMAIPEPVPYIEAEADEDTSPRADKRVREPVASQASGIPAAPDNPFETALLSEGEGGADTLVEGTDALQPPGPIATVPVESSPSSGQPLSARLEHDSEPAMPRLPSSQRSMEGSVHEVVGSPATAGLAAGEGTQLTPGGVAAAHQALESSSPRRLSRQASRESPGPPLGRQESGAEGGQLRHMRQASHDSAATVPGSWHSRQNSMDLSLMSIRGTVLYEFVAETDDELSVAPGDAIVIQAEVDGWFQVTRTSDGRRGLIPASYATAT